MGLAFTSDLPRVVPSDILSGAVDGRELAEGYREALQVALAQIVTLQGYLTKLRTRHEQEWGTSDE